MLAGGGDSFELMLDGNKIKHQFVQTEMEGFLRDLKTDYSAKSSGKCLYATVYKSDCGLDVKGQLDLVVRAADRGRSVR